MPLKFKLNNEVFFLAQPTKNYEDLLDKIIDKFSLNKFYPIKLTYQDTDLDIIQLESQLDYESLLKFTDIENTIIQIFIQAQKLEQLPIMDENLNQTQLSSVFKIDEENQQDFIDKNSQQYKTFEQINLKTLQLQEILQQDYNTLFGFVRLYKNDNIDELVDKWFSQQQ